MRTPQQAFRPTQALRHEVSRPPIHPDRVAAEYGRMYAWLRADDELAAVCGFGAAELTEGAEAARIADLRREIGARGRTFTVSDTEMAAFVRHAWISADRCSGRQYATLPAVVRYLPDVRTGEDMLRAAVGHARLAMEGGTAGLAPRSVMTVLGAPTPSQQLGQLFLTEQLVRFAGYTDVAGTRLGDGGYHDLTQWVLDRTMELLPPTPGPFDVLPMIAVGADGRVVTGTCPPEHHYLVDIPWPRHPDRQRPGDWLRWPGRGRAPVAPWVARAGRPDSFACWTALPLQTNFALDIAGQRYPVLFNGWYVDEEIVVNLLAADRYGWAERVSAVIHGDAGRRRLRRDDRLDEYRTAQIEIAMLRAVRAGFRAARRKVDKLGPSQIGFGRFRERYQLLHGEEPPNDTGWTANRVGSRYRYPSHCVPHVRQTWGSQLVRHRLTFRSLHPDSPVSVVDLAQAPASSPASSSPASSSPASLHLPRERSPS